MDAYLAVEAHQTLQALGSLSAKPGLSGFLIGHKRGHRFFVERIFPLPKGFRPTLENYESLNRLLDGKIIGFFAFPAGTKDKEQMLQPFACGKLFLGVRLSKKGSLNFQSLVIDYDGHFFTAPIKLQK
jgi:hypothetical protein